MLTRFKIPIFLILMTTFSTSGQQVISPYCPNSYSLINGLCYPNYATTQQPCQQFPCFGYTCPCPTSTTNPTTVPTVIPTTTSTTTKVPPTLCSNNLVRIGGVCRLMYCSRGELHEGRCIEPKCNNGTVWIGGKCTVPGRLRTILEVETHFTTHANLTDPVIEKPKITNEVIYHTEAPEPEPDTTKRCTRVSKTEKPSTKKCCRLVSPRMCRIKFNKWLCTHRHHLRCDDFCGTYRLTFLTIPKIIEEDGALLMPSNPTLHGCNGTDCSTDGPNDCSGCLSGHKETCSEYCYQILCPHTYCRTLDQAEYCKEYPESSACTRSGGCFLESCYNDYDCEN